MDIRVNGKVAVVTGGSRGIGRATAVELLRSGAEGVTITSRRQENLEESVAAMTELGISSDQVLAIAARADDPEAAESTVAQTIERFGSCDILVNNAGTNPSGGPLMEVELGAIEKTWSVNQLGPLIWSRAVWQAWMKENGGVICSVASVGGLRPAPFLGAYNISKAAVVHMTQQLAFELAPTVRVNAVAPGVVKTRLSEMLWKNQPEQAARTHPLDQLGEPEDVARAIVFLCSDQSDWLTGVIMPVDGGVIGASATLG